MSDKEIFFLFIISLIIIIFIFAILSMHKATVEVQRDKANKERIDSENKLKIKTFEKLILDTLLSLSSSDIPNRLKKWEADHEKKFNEELLHLKKQLEYKHKDEQTQIENKIQEFIISLTNKKELLSKEYQELCDSYDNKLSEYQKKLENKFNIDKEIIEREITEQQKSLTNKKELLAKENEDVAEQYEIISKNNKELKKYIKFLFSNTSNSYPALSAAISDICTEKYLDYEKYLRMKSRPAFKKSEEVSMLRKELKGYIKLFHETRYLLQSYESLFPWIVEFKEYEIDDILKDTSNDYKDLDDPVKYYVPLHEYNTLTEEERNQLALNRYLESYKSKTQIGRLYERFIGYEYEKLGYKVEFFGALNGFEDLGRDLIAKKGKSVLIIQCKYWSKEKEIHENAICQLYGTALKYSIEHEGIKINPILITSTKCSDMAHEFGKALNVQIIENKPLNNYPMIKCNIGKDGEKIYHLPIDQQYDKVKIELKKGEFYAESCMDASLHGYRRAYKWHG